MVHFVIAGKLACKNYVQVLNVAAYLNQNLPAFDFTKLEIPVEEWDEYLVKINREQKWHHALSPLIYKEIYTYGTKKPILIGSISEFWEYCYDYYGLELVMTEEEIEALQKDNLNLNEFTERNKNKNEASKVMIYGATNQMTPLLLPEMMKLEKCGEVNGFQFLLYDENLDTFNTAFFEEFNEEFKDMYGAKAIYCDNLGKQLADINMLIIIDDTSQLLGTQNEEAMRNYLLQIFFLAEEINMCGNRDMKIIFANNGLSCLVATILAYKTHIPYTQIVVVSSDLGLGYLGEMSRRLDIQTNKMCAPPVWGSLGLNEFVDVCSTLIKSKVYKPYARAVTATKNSTLIHGTIHCELRFINYLSDQITDLKETVNKRREIVREKLQRAPMLAKIEGLLSLLKIWFGCSGLKDPIISLGIMSDGSFDIPPGIVFSQPAIPFRNGFIPYSNYPLPDTLREQIAVAGQEAEIHYKKYSGADIFKDTERSFHAMSFEKLNDQDKRSALYSLISNASKPRTSSTAPISSTPKDTIHFQLSDTHKDEDDDDDNDVDLKTNSKDNCNNLI